MKKYRSKRDKNIVALFDSENAKGKTTTLVYETGEKKGKSFTISNSTLHLYWELIEDEPASVLDFSQEQLKQINTPYKPDVVPHYIPKPKSVIEYEDKQHKNRFNSELPTFEELGDIFGPILKKINEKSKYVLFKDGTALHRQSACMKLNTTEIIWEQLSLKGLESKPNNDKDRPFAFIIKSRTDYDIMSEILINTITTN